jgi:hypothetical protein
MMKLYQKIKYKTSLLYYKFNNLLLAIMVLGILELGLYYELMVSMMTLLAPELAPIIIILLLWIMYKGIRRLYKNSKNKKYILL